MGKQTEFIVAALEGFVEDVMKKVTVETTANLIEDTPVDLGWARANWVPQIGEPRTTVVGTPNDVTSGPQERGITEVITQYKMNKGSIYITNNVPYIGRLNDGSSQQAPTAFVQSAIAKAIKKVSR